MIFIYPQREYHIIWRGLCLLYSRGSPEPKWDNKLKFPRLVFILTAFIGELWVQGRFQKMEKSSSKSPSKEKWHSIKNEELVHIGELLGLINYLDPEQKQFVQKGLSEFYELQK